MEASARTLFQSLQKFKQQPDYLQIWPGHGAGSACGKGLSSIPTSTVGYERLFNWAFQSPDENPFVHAVLAGQPEPPKYFAEMKRINKEGPRVLHGFHVPDRLPAAQLASLLAAKALVIDTRSSAAFAGQHVPGTINIPLDRSFTTWAGWLVPYTREFYLIVDDTCEHCTQEAVRDLAMIGLDRVAGYFGADVVHAWEIAGRPLDTVPQISAHELHSQIEKGVRIIDVRGASEWEAGHIPGVPNLPLGYLVERLAEVPRDEPVILQCQAGGRSAIAASVLLAHGYTNVINLTGGISAWQAASYAVTRGSTR